MEKLSGFSPILVDAEPFEIDGKTYQFRRLGVADTFKIINIVKTAAVSGHLEAQLALRNFEFNKGLAWVLAPLMGLPEVEVLVMDFLDATLREIFRDSDGKPDFRDVELLDYTKFQMSAILIVLANLSLHPDIKAFFVTMGNLQEHPAIKNLLEALQSTQMNSGKTPSI